MAAEIASATTLFTKFSNLTNSALAKLTNATGSLVEKALEKRVVLIPSLAIAATALLTQTWALSQNKRIPMSPLGLGYNGGGTVTNKVFSDQPPQKVHLVVLVHGWLGNELEMSSIQQELEAGIERMKTEDDENPEGSKRISEDTMFVVHSATCNNGKTTDGIEAGGARVAKEVNQLIERLLDDQEPGAEESSTRKNNREKTLTLSFIGNSLGGLYARSCLSKIVWELPNGNKVIPNVFCTTATPHLGKRGLTYLPLPRFAEEGIGHALRPTGQDLFGITNEIERLATESKYIDPLQQFSKRIAYANAFGTDLQVPTATAAFLSDTDSPHITLETQEPFLLTVETPRNDEVLKSASEIALKSTTGNDIKSHIPASIMARVLDAMGWTKVFADVRDQLVSVPVPFKNDSRSDFKAKDKYTSQELKAVMANRIVHDKKWPIPFGHTMLIANSKSDFYAKINAGGLPFVQQLAADMLKDILAHPVSQSL